MAIGAQQRVRGRPAHTPGPTYLCYTPDGKRLVTAGSNNAIRVYTTGSVGEPVTIDDCQESNTAVVAGNDFFLAGSEDGTVSSYSLQTNHLQDVLVRCTLPVRDLALSPDFDWVAVASDELVVKVVNVKDMTRVLYLREQSKPVKHLSFHPKGSHITVSCSDGLIYVYSLSKEEPELLKKVDGLIRSLETDAEASSRVAWHPDGRAFAAPTATRDVQVMSWDDWERQRVFASDHTGDITALAWSPNGALLATAGADGHVLLWDTKTQKILMSYDYPNVLSMAWHPTENILSFANTDGEVFIYTDFVPNEHVSLLKKSLQPAPFIHDPLAEVSGNARRPLLNGIASDSHNRHKRKRTPDSLDDVLGSDGTDVGEDFIIDDDGAGYAERINGFGKPNHNSLEDGPLTKRRATYGALEPKLHQSFQPGSTPWRGNRRYLCLNLIGSVWSVDQESHNTVTVEFYDREYHRDFHFTDVYLWDKACLNDTGTAFSCPPRKGDPAMIFYRPHETWTSRVDWRTPLPEGETVIAISLSESFIIVSTSSEYIRIFTLYGTPYRVYRQKSTPAVTCTSWRDYVLTIGNGALISSPDGSTTSRLTYTVENIKRDEICQNEDILPLPAGASIQNVFFSVTGDPYIYDTTGTLLVCLHWRTPNQARWIPVLETPKLARLAGGGKQETYFPIGVSGNKFHCIILKGGEKYPYFPRPLLSEFDMKIPITTITSSTSTSTSENNNNDGDESHKLQESFLRHSLAANLLEDLLGATNATFGQKNELARKHADVDKVLLQLLALECRVGEERGMRALELVRLMGDRSGKMLEAAVKIAERYRMDLLGERIREIAEKRLVGEDVDEG